MEIHDPMKFLSVTILLEDLTMDAPLFVQQDESYTNTNN